MGFMIEVKKDGQQYKATAKTAFATGTFTANDWQSAFRMASSFAFERINQSSILVA